MRIRKRPLQPPPPSPRTPASGGSEPSDHRLSLIGKWVSFGAATAGSLPQKETGAQIKDQEELKEKLRSSNDSRKGSILVAEAAGTGLTLPIQSFFVQGERSFPLKKRRGSFSEEETTKIADMKTKMNKKCGHGGGDGGQEVAGGSEEDGATRVDKQKGKLKRARGNSIMEGSRCSRVNGRGWRCCQQTLVGYSLCEHHLGKGRIRNITSVKGRGVTIAAAVAPESNNENITICSGEEKEERKDDNADGGEEEEGGNDEVKPSMNKKKGSKIGMVKARSLSSLLGQADSGTGAVQHQQYVGAEIDEKDNELL